MENKFNHQPKMKKNAEEMELLADKVCKEELGQEPSESNLSFRKVMVHGMNKWEEYRSQASELPSDEEIDAAAIEFVNSHCNHSSGDLTQETECFDGGVVWLRSIASPLLSSRDARINECTEVIKELLHTYIINLNDNGQPKASIKDIMKLIDRATNLITPPKP